MKTTPLLLAALACALAGTADANVWQRAIDKEKADAQSQYEAALTAGDDHAAQANTRGVSLSTALRLVDASIGSYRSAAKLRPNEGEPWFRIGSVLNHYFFECVKLPHVVNPETCALANDEARGRALVEAFDTFERLAPLDPRVTQILNQRAIIRTKMVSVVPADIENVQRTLARRDLTDVQRRDAEERLKKLEKENTDRRTSLLTLAAKDYQSMIDHADGLNSSAIETSHGNLAETYMMVGKLEEAIDAYRVAIRVRGGDETILYGYAVALDRDDQGVEALRVIRSLKHASFESFAKKHSDGIIFYVPRGEAEYYFALVHEAFGEIDESIERWQNYIKSGAHPQYQPRAKAHLDALIKQRGKAKPPAPPEDPIRDFR